MNRLFFILGLLLGFWLGVMITELRLAHEPQVVYREILPSPAYYGEGKRSEPGKLSPEKERELHAQAVWQIFKSGRDPFEQRVR